MAVPLTDSIINIVRHDFASGQWSPVTRRWLSQLAGEPTSTTAMRARGATVEAEPEVQSMTAIPTRLWATVSLGTSLAILLTASATVILDTITARNSDDNACTIEAHVVPAGGSATDANKLVSVLLAAGAWYAFAELVGHVLEPGESVQMRASVDGVVTTRGSGRVVTGG